MGVHVVCTQSVAHGVAELLRRNSALMRRACQQCPPLLVSRHLRCRCVCRFAYTHEFSVEPAPGSATAPRVARRSGLAAWWGRRPAAAMQRVFAAAACALSVLVHGEVRAPCVSLRARPWAASDRAVLHLFAATGLSARIRGASSEPLLLPRPPHTIRPVHRWLTHSAPLTLRHCARLRSRHLSMVRWVPRWACPRSRPTVSR